MEKGINMSNSINNFPQYDQPCHWDDLEHRKILNGFVDTLDLMAVGIIMVNNLGHIIYTNEVGSAIIKERSSLKISSEGLISASCPSESATLKKLIANAVSIPSKTMSHITLGNASSTMALTIGILHLQISNSPVVPCAAIYVVDQENPTAAPSHVFEKLYGLTRREAELTVALAKGVRVSEYASHQSISLNTVNSQLKSIMSKTYTCRQADLVRLVVTSFPAFSSIARNS
jgi:DNA-binding CsgD family transcriptional regulator